MSDAPQDPGWWQGTDGRWYPPPGYSATGYPDPGVPPPGYPPPGYPPAGWAAPATNSKAITALILGVLGLTTCYAVTGIPAIVLARQAQREIDASAGAQTGRAMATTGLVLGAIATALTTVFILALVALVAFGVAVDPGDDDWTPTPTVSIPR